MMKFNGEQKKSFLMSAIFGVIIGFAILFLLTLLLSLIMSAAKISPDAAKVIAVVILGVSGLFSGFASAKKLKSRALVIGAVTGLLFYLTVAVISAAVTKSGFTSVFLLRVLICFAASEIGAVLSTVKRNKSKYI